MRRTCNRYCDGNRRQRDSASHQETLSVASVDNNVRDQRFEIRSDGDMAFLSYRPKDGAIALIHTEVPEALEGRGIGTTLAAGAFAYARSRQLRVEVICPFVARWLERHPEQRDIVM